MVLEWFCSCGHKEFRVWVSGLGQRRHIAHLQDWISFVFYLGRLLVLLKIKSGGPYHVYVIHRFVVLGMFFTVACVRLNVLVRSLVIGSRSLSPIQMEGISSFLMTLKLDKF